MFHVPKGIVTDGGISLCPSSKCTSLQSWGSRGPSWLMTFGIQIVTELLQPLSPWPHIYFSPVSYKAGTKFRSHEKEMPRIYMENASYMFCSQIKNEPKYWNCNYSCPVRPGPLPRMEHRGHRDY